jgi:hypothetical protein
MKGDHDEFEVLTGSHGDLTWSVVAAGTRSDLMTTLRISQNGQLRAASGFGGPALHAGELVNEWRGRTDGLPWFVMVRTDATVIRVTAQTDHGSLVELSLSAPHPRLGLRFAAAGLPSGEGPGVLLVHTVDQPTRTIAQPVPRPRG